MNLRKTDMVKKVISMMLVLVMTLTLWSPIQVDAAPKKTSVSKTVEITVGETQTLKAFGKGQETTWNSSDSEVVTVSEEGVIKGIAPGKATITAKYATHKTEKKSFEIVVLQGETKDYYTVSFDYNFEGAPEIDAQNVKHGEYAQEPESPEREGYIFVGWYLSDNLETITDAFDFQRTPITNSITLYAIWIGSEDTDGDKLLDDLEIYYGTDINKQDTDTDGLSDYDEIVNLGTDPLKKNTDAEKPDGEQDADGDGITNKEEIAVGMDPVDKDSDCDGIEDNEESQYATDPVKYDTDGDGAGDGTEIKLGTDPLKADSAFNVSVKAEESDDTVQAKVDVTLKGEQIETLSVNALNDENLFPKDMPGYMGKAYNFNVDGTFDKATVCFTFDTSKLGEDSEPTIFYFNEEEQSLEELETIIIGNEASAIVEHFSTYVLVDRKIYYDSFKWEDTWDTEGKYNSVEIVLVIDDSGSMTSNDRDNQRLEVARNLIDKLPENSKVGVVKFANSVELLTSELTSDREVAKQYLTASYFRSSGGTYMYKAVEETFGLFNGEENDVLKMMVVLSDGETSDTSKHSAAISLAQEKNVRIYTVGLGNSSSYFTNYLKPLAENTNASFYLAANAGELVGIYEEINKRIDIETDADDDGLKDYYEDNMVAFNGRKITCDKTKKDTDGDGVIDGEEVEVELVYNEDHTKVYVKGKINSYPDMEDSDNDSILDADDPQPLEYTITDRTLSFVEGLSYSNLASYVGKTVGQAIESGANIKGISEKNVQYLKDAVIVHANNSDSGYWKDFWDSGLGSVALKFVRRTENTAIVYSLRGTEFGSDFVNDTTADVILFVGLDCEQSRNAFDEYRDLASNNKYDYYVTGHSLGGRLAQDVIYKTYNKNEGGWFSEGAGIPTPVHSATFNALGYNKVAFALLENDVIAQYKNKLTNYYYWLDLVGEGMGNSGVCKRSGTDVELLCKDINGKYYRDEEFEQTFLVRDSDYHGIDYFQNDYDLLYTSGHSFDYWVD